MDEVTRKLIFLGVCIPLRLLVAYLVYTVRSKKAEKKSMVTKEAMVIIVSLIAFGLLGAYTNRCLNPDEEHKGGFGEGVYWNSAVHSVFYFAGALMLSNKGTAPYASIVLLLDMIPAAYYFMHKYYNHIINPPE